MADGTPDSKPSLWRRVWPFGRSKPVVGRIGRATSRSKAMPLTAKVADEALPASEEVTAAPKQALNISGDLKAGAASLSGTGTVSAAAHVVERDAKTGRLGIDTWGGNPSGEVETPAQSTDGDVYVTPGPAVARGSTGDPSVIIEQRTPHLESGATEPPGNLLLEDGENLQLEGGEDAREPEQAGVTVETKMAELKLTTHPADVTVTQGSGRQTLNVEQLRQSIRQTFRGDKVAILEWVSVAQDTTEALQKTLENAGINNEATAAKAREFLIFQRQALDNIQQLVEDDATEEAARTFREWLARAAQTALSVIGEPGIIRGIVTTGALCALGYFGAFAPASAGLIAAGMMRLDKTTLELLATMHGKKAD